MDFQSHVYAASFYKLLFAGDCAVNAASEEDMQRNMDLFAAACDSFGLIINAMKAVVMHQPSLNATYVALQINVDGALLPAVDNFTYLGSTFSSDTKIGDEVSYWISKACRPPCCHWIPPTKRSSPTLKGYPGDFPKAPRKRRGQLRRPRPRPTGLEEDSENRCSDLRRQPHHKTKHEVRKSQLPHEAMPKLNRLRPPRRSFRAPIGLIGHLRTNCSTPMTSLGVPQSTSASPLMPTVNTQPPLPSSSVTTTSAATAPLPTATLYYPDSPTNVNLIAVNTSDVDLV
ncbi:hypothetical protein SprV_0100239100 [Sparganum proliferum]